MLPLLSLAAVSFSIPTPPIFSTQTARRADVCCQMSSQPDEWISGGTRGPGQRWNSPSWDFRHGSGRGSLAATEAINGAPAMIEEDYRPA